MSVEINHEMLSEQHSCWPPKSCKRCATERGRAKRKRTLERGDDASPTVMWLYDHGYILGACVMTPDGYGTVEREGHRQGNKVVVSVRLDDGDLRNYTKADFKGREV